MLENQTIPFFDLKRQFKQIKSQVLEKTIEVFESTSYSGGEFVAEFEKKFASYCNIENAVGVNNGTSALHLALLSLGIGEGDEVIVPANTFIASAWAISYVRANPVFVDCTSDTWQIDPNEVLKKITPKTKAIIGVHLYGHPFDLEKIQKIAHENNLFLIEDCAQAHGALYKNTKIGTFGDIACFSFYPGKNLGSFGEGGAIITKKTNYAETVSSLRNHGATIRYHHDKIGFNMRMEGIQGAILSIKLNYLDSWNQRRKEIARRYINEIKNERIKLQKQATNVESVFHLFVVTTENRDELREFLSQNNIETALHYPIPCHLQKAYSYLGHQKGDFPNSEYLSNHCLSLPLFPELRDDEIDLIIAALNRYA